MSEEGSISSVQRASGQARSPPNFGRRPSLGNITSCSQRFAVRSVGRVPVKARRPLAPIHRGWGSRLTRDGRSHSERSRGADGWAQRQWPIRLDTENHQKAKRPAPGEAERILRLAQMAPAKAVACGPASARRGALPKIGRPAMSIIWRIVSGCKVKRERFRGLSRIKFR